MKTILNIFRSLFLVSLLTLPSNADHKKNKARRGKSVLRKAPGEYRICRPKFWFKGRSRQLIPTIITPYDSQVLISDGTIPAEVVLKMAGRRGGNLVISRNLPNTEPGERSIVKRNGEITQDKSVLSSQTVMLPNYAKSKKSKHVVEDVLNVEKLEIDCEVVDFNTAVEQKNRFEAQKFLLGVPDEENRLRDIALRGPAEGIRSFYNDFFNDYYQNIFAAFKDPKKIKAELEKLKKLAHDSFWAVKEGGQMLLDAEAFNAYYSLDPNWIEGFQLVHLQENAITLAKSGKILIPLSEISANLGKAEKKLARVTMGADQRKSIQARIQAARKEVKKLIK